MKPSITFLIFVLYAVLILPQDTSHIPAYFYKRLEGKINDKQIIQMNLTGMDSVLDGNYFYEYIGEPIYFQYYSSIKTDGSFHIEEEGGYDEDYNTIITGIFDGKFTSFNDIKGKWINYDSSRVYNFNLYENYPSGSAKFDIKHAGKSYGESENAASAVTIDLSYPVMMNYTDPNVQNKINDYIMNFYLRSSIERDSGYAGIDDRIDSFIASYLNEIEADSQLYSDYKPVYENSEFTSISFNSDYILSLEIIESLYTGGAHGNSYFSLASFDLTTGNQIKLDDIFYGKYKKRLNEVGERIFRQQFKADSTKSLFDQGYFGFETGFALNDNFDLYKGGIKFQFNPYEAGAYVLGAPEVFIPYSQIRDLIRNDSPLGKMLSKIQSR
jgi:hypothetical protein